MCYVNNTKKSGHLNFGIKKWEYSKFCKLKGYSKGNRKGRSYSLTSYKHLTKCKPFIDHVHLLI